MCVYVCVLVQHFLLRSLSLFIFTWCAHANKQRWHLTCHWWVRINNHQLPSSTSHMHMHIHIHVHADVCTSVRRVSYRHALQFSIVKPFEAMKRAQAIHANRSAHTHSHIRAGEEIFLFLCTTKITNAAFSVSNAKAKGRSQTQITLTLTNAGIQSKLCKRRTQIEKFAKYCKAQHTHTNTHQHSSMLVHLQAQYTI